MKKQLLFFFALALGLSACNQKGNDFKVNVSLKNGNDQTVYLQKYVDNTPVTIDSAVIANEMATLTVPKDNPQILYALKIKGKRGSMPFFADNKDVAFVGDMNNPQDVEIMASETQTELDAYNNQLEAFESQISELYAVMNEAFSNNDSIMMDSLNKVGTALMEQQDSFRDDYIKAHPDSFVTHYILDGVKQDYPLNELKELVGTFTTESIYKDDLNDYITKLERLEVGQPFIDFTLKTKDNTELVLSEIIAQNKLTLVDFWASWCGPCKAEAPNVIAVYEKYRDKGLVVIGVPVNDKQEATEKAMRDLGIHYPQVLDPSQALAERFNIVGIPYIILFAPDGSIVAAGLRGAQIEEAVGKVLK